MCRIINRSQRKSFIGYKIALKNKSGDYISLATGIKYKTGERINPANIKNAKRYSGFFRDDLMHPACSVFEPKMEGKTGVFIFMKDARSFLNDVCKFSIGFDTRLVLLRMEISENLYNAGFAQWDMIVGDKINMITEIEEIKEEVRKQIAAKYDYVRNKGFFFKPDKYSKAW